jgi:curved DNA-binding protein
MARDYYAILGVDRSATPEEIKKAFRKLALEHHPDRAKDKKAAEAKFKEINEAYAVLSDEQKRRQYDMFGPDQFRQQYTQEDIFSDSSFGSIQDILGDLGFGGDIFSRVFGRFGRSTRYPRSANPFSGGFSGQMRGQDGQSEITIGFDEAVLGGDRQLSIGQPGGPPRTLKVRIPPGSRDGSKLRLKGQGGAGPPGAPPGDLYLTIRVTPHPRFAWRGERDLQVEVGVPVVDLVLGGSVAVPTLGGGEKRVKIRPFTQPGTALRLKGLGAPQAGSTPAGDLYAIIEALIPESISQEQKELFEALKKSGL